MSDQMYVAAIAVVILSVVALGVLRKSFDPFAPVWMFLAGFAQVYVVQAISYREYALRVRGVDLVTAANARALWAILWFLLVYFSGIGKTIAARLPRPPVAWSPWLVTSISPLLVLWGLVCAGLAGGTSDADDMISPEEALFRSFPIVMLVGAILLLVTGRNSPRPRLAYTGAGLFIAVVYILIWMIRGRRTPPLFGLLATICAFYVSRGKRPSKPVLAGTAFASMMVVSLALGFRGNKEYEHSLSGFLHFAGDFRIENVLTNLNLKTNDDEATKPEEMSHETEEYGGYLLMMDTVPEKSEYDYGTSYLRLVSTYIPRLIWRNKPLFGREQWINAWIAGSEFKRGEDFTGPAIGILGATQLNGGAWGTVIVLGLLALLLRTAYEFFRRNESYPWAQVWWSLTFYNAWLMTVNDDPFVWFYYIYGHTVLPPMVLIWLFNKLAAPKAPAIDRAGWDQDEPVPQGVRP